MQRHRSSVVLLSLLLVASLTPSHAAEPSSSSRSVHGSAGASAITNTPFPNDTIRRYTVDRVASDVDGLGVGSRILVGADPTGPLAGHEGELAALGKLATWTFLTPRTGDQVFDAQANAQYLYTGDASLFGGLWVDSRWRRLTPERPKWVPAGVLGRDTLLTSTNHGEWFFVSAYDDDFTITLPNPFAGDLTGMGMELVLEPFDGASGTAYLEVDGGGTILVPEGYSTTRYALPRGKGRKVVFRAVAGNVASGSAWYLVVGP
ncbi:MAG: DUF2793 domain-containing protein [Acidobacteriota bacterium]